MKYCTKCGKELFDEAVICPGCGCAVEAPEAKNTEQVKSGQKNVNGKKSRLKIALIIAASVVLLIGIVTGGIFLQYHIRSEAVKDQLAGKTFSYWSSSLYGYSSEKLSFDENANCEKTYFYSNVMDEPTTYSMSYKIKFKNGKTFLDTGGHMYEIQFNSYGDINSLYDVNNKSVYN